MVGRLFILLIAVVFLFSISTNKSFAIAEDPRRQIQEDSDLFHYIVVRNIRWNGQRWSRVQSSPGRIVKTHPYMFILGRDEIEKELELSKDQKLQIEDWRKEVISHSRRAYRHMGAGGSEGVMDPKFYADRKRFDQQLSDILLPIQIERLEEVKLRIEMRRVGVITFLSEICGLDSVQLREDLRVSADKSGISGNYVQECVEELLTSISAEKRKDVKEFMERHLAKSPDIDLLLSHIRVALMIKDEIGLSSDARFEKLLLCRPLIQLTSEGSWDLSLTPVNMQIDTQQFLELAATQHLLSDTTLESLEQRKLAYDSAMAKLFAERDSFMANKPSVDEIDAFNKTIWAAQEQEGLDYQHDVESLMNESETESLRRFIAFDLYPQIGVFTLLLHGDLGRDLALREGEKRELRKRAGALIENTERRLAEFEEEFLKLAFSRLPEKEKELILLKLGKPLVYIKPVFSDFR